MKDDKEVHAMGASRHELDEVGAIIGEALNEAQTRGHNITVCLATMTYMIGVIVKQMGAELDWEGSVASVFPGMKADYDDAPPLSEEQQRLAEERFPTKTKKSGGFNGH